MQGVKCILLLDTFMVLPWNKIKILGPCLFLFSLPDFFKYYL